MQVHCTPTLLYIENNSFQTVLSNMHFDYLFTKKFKYAIFIFDFCFFVQNNLKNIQIMHKLTCTLRQNTRSELSLMNRDTMLMNVSNGFYS